MFAAPVPGDVLDLVGVGLAGRRVIQDQKTVAPVHKRLGFLPKRLRVWRLSLQQASESVMRWRVLLVLFFFSGCERAASVQVNTFCAAIRKWM